MNEAQREMLKRELAMPLSQKHRRAIRAKCAHEEIYSSTVTTPDASYTNRVCLDCGQWWHETASATTVINAYVRRGK